MASHRDMTGTIVPSSTVGESKAPPVTPPPVQAAGVSLQDPSKSELSEFTPQQHWARDPRIPAWLLSLVLHTVVLVVLAIWTYNEKNVDSGVVLLSRRGEPVATPSFEILKRPNQDNTPHKSSSDQPVNVTLQLHSANALVLSPSQKQNNAPVLSEMERALLATGGAPSKAKLTRLAGGGLSGRTPEGRTKYGQRYGANQQSEDAVELALKWLAAHQRPNGSWSFDLTLDPCDGKCADSRKSKDTPTPATAATGLALLSFLGAGYTHQSGTYAQTIRRGLYYLRDAAGQAHHGYDFQQGSMYGQGIALMALSEALYMTTSEDGKRDSNLFHLVELGANFTDGAQHDSGSWGYVPGSPGDTTLTGWQVLSLVAAARNGVSLRTNTLPRAKRFLLDVVGNDQYEFGYKGPPAEPTTTAIGLTLLLYLGETPGMTHFDRAFDRLAARGPTLTNVYHDYYATLALHHVRHSDWDQWNTRLRNHLVSTQSKQGHQAGSWHFKDRWGDIGGRLYTTCMCTMMLEVYYRYLPMYGEIEEFPL